VIFSFPALFGGFQMHYGSKSWLTSPGQSQTRVLIATFAIVGFTVSGCDNIPAIPTAGELLGNGEESADTDTAAGTTTTTEVIAPPERVVPAGPTPQQIVDQFTSLRSNEITDGTLAQLASSPEAAAAITEIDMHGAQISAKGLGYLGALPNLETLNVSNSPVAADSLTALAKAQSLKNINLSNSDANDRVISELSQIPHLQTLDLSGTPVTGGSATGLGSMRELTELSLMGTSADDQVVAALASLPLRKLDLSKSRITSASLPSILKISTLESLNVSFCAVKGAAFKGINRTGIKDLNVGETLFGIDGFKAIKGMKSLEKLNIYQTGLVQHKSCNVFRTFPNLKTLNAGKNGIGDPGMVVFFKGHKTLEELKLHQNKDITDNGLAALIAVKTLRVLDVTSTSCGAAGGRALKAKLPECTIHTSGGTF
jgi:Leucine-rich repeat (LRR) protein